MRINHKNPLSKWKDKIIELKFVRKAYNNTLKRRDFRFYNQAIKTQ
jgi:hypothetical protein